MSRKVRAEALGDDEPELNISSLIDICFLLLIYFLVTSTIAAREADTQVQLPATTPSEDVPEVKPMLIKVSAQGVVSINRGLAEEQLDSDPAVHHLPLLSDRLATYAGMTRAGGQEPFVQIEIDDEARHQRAIDVLDVLKTHQISKIAFIDLGKE